jgi:endoglucanase
MGADDSAPSPHDPCVKPDPGRHCGASVLEQRRSARQAHVAGGRPASDRHLHYYQPFKFTHQGTSFTKGSDAWLGTTWRATPAEIQALSNDFDKASVWSARTHRPVYLGEFGASEPGDMESRVSWTRAVVHQAESRNFSWGYWSFINTFGVYDPANSTWKQPLLKALLHL